MSTAITYRRDPSTNTTPILHADIVATVIDFASYDVLVSLRLVSRGTKYDAERRLYRSLILIEPPCHDKGEDDTASYYDLRTPAGEFDPGDPERRVPIDPRFLRLDVKFVTPVEAIEAARDAVCRHLRILRARTTGRGTCAFRAGAENSHINSLSPRWRTATHDETGTHLSAYIQERTIYCSSARISTDLDVRYVQVAFLGPGTSLGPVPYRARRVVVNVSFWRQECFDESNAVTFHHAWKASSAFARPKGSGEVGEGMDLVFRFIPFPVTEGSEGGEYSWYTPEARPFGILTDIVELAASRGCRSLTLVGVDKLPMRGLPVAAQAALDLDTEAGLQGLARIIQDAVNTKRSPVLEDMEGLQRSADYVKVECVSEQAYRRTVGEVQYRLQMELNAPLRW